MSAKPVESHNWPGHARRKGESFAGRSAEADAGLGRCGGEGADQVSTRAAEMPPNALANAHARRKY